MDEPACTLRCAGVQDVPAMLDFEQKYFESCWQSIPKVLKSLIQKDPMMFRLCKVGQKLKGFYGVVPLPYEIWHKVLQGDIKEEEAVSHMVSFKAPEIYLYVYSVIVDLADKQHKIYTRALIRDFARQYVLGQNQKRSNIRAVGAFTVSEGGRRLVERSNFIYKGGFRGANGKLVRSYVIRLENLAQQVKIFRDKRKKILIA
ncbi:MAG: hypothetical protein PHT79_07880 [Syntrophomonadaceae bacterium]|nr:hypothetical protein [Syntrophomonadaceae bacterium]